MQDCGSVGQASCRRRFFCFLPKKSDFGILGIHDHFGKVTKTHIKQMVAYGGHQYKLITSQNRRPQALFFPHKKQVPGFLDMSHLKKRSFVEGGRGRVLKNKILGESYKKSIFTVHFNWNFLFFLRLLVWVWLGDLVPRKRNLETSCWEVWAWRMHEEQKGNRGADG